MDVVPEEEVEFIAFSVVDYLHLGLDPFADSLAAGLGVLVSNVPEYLVAFFVDKLNQIVSLLQRDLAVILKHFFEVVQNVL